MRTSNFGPNASFPPCGVLAKDASKVAFVILPFRAMLSDFPSSASRPRGHCRICINLYPFHLARVVVQSGVPVLGIWR